MVREYKVKRKLQEQSGSFFVILPKIWVNSLELEEGDLMSVEFNGIVKVKPPTKSQRTSDLKGITP
jgi:antitoxin component of MazEF toxin-antitoxin module